MSNLSYTHSKGGYSLVEKYNTEIGLIATLLDEKSALGVYQLTWKDEELPTGFYYCRYQNKGY